MNAIREMKQHRGSGTKEERAREEAGLVKHKTGTGSVAVQLLSVTVTHALTYA